MASFGVTTSFELAVQRPVPPQFTHTYFGTVEGMQDPVLEPREMRVHREYAAGLRAPRQIMRALAGSGDLARSRGTALHSAEDYRCSRHSGCVCVYGAELGAWALPRWALP